MTNDHNKHKKRTLGAYYTPDLTVKYIVEKTIPYLNEKSKVLDPAAGDGIFLKKMKDQGAKSIQLYAYDVNPEVIPDLRKITPNAVLKDSLQQLEGEYDIIVGNPPYSSNEADYIKIHREKLRKLYNPIPPSNLYSLFCVAALRHLKEGGVLSVIILDSFISNVYYAPFREYLLNNCKIKEILLAPRRLFHPIGADVRTAILTVEKCSGLDKIDERNNNTVKLIDRVEIEKEYWKPTKVQEVKQGFFYKLPDHTFFINVPEKIIQLLVQTKVPLGKVLDGGTGISTGNDERFLKKGAEVVGNSEWVGYYKNGIRKAYYYEPTMFIEKKYKKYSASIRNYMIRNERFFFNEGITCASVGVGFSASYMPAGNLFGVNANFFTKDKTELFYALGLLNSKVARYILKAILNRTNNISSKYIQKLPYVIPEKKKKEEIANSVERIVESLKKNTLYDFSKEQQELDEQFFSIYGISGKEREAVEQFTEDIYNRL